MNILRRIEKRIHGRRTTLVGSVDEMGYPAVRAFLGPRKMVGLKVFYFSTNTSSRHVEQFLCNGKACIYFYSRFRFWGVMLRGEMEVLEDKQSKELIWRNGDTQYYKKGVTDPDYCVLRFTAHGGRFYNKFRSEDFTIE